MRLGRGRSWGGQWENLKFLLKSEDQRGAKSFSTFSGTAEAAAANSGLPPASSEQTNSL